jgi:hypothetical protein
VIVYPTWPHWWHAAIDNQEDSMGRNNGNNGAAAGSGAIYGLGIFGAWVWFWQQADGFWEYVGAILQGIVWPAFMVYEGFKALAG